MKVEHVSYCSSNDPEYQAAEKLKQQFEHIDNNGYVLITSGIKMPPGCRVKDLDIVVAGYFKDYYIEDFQYPRYFNGYRSDKSGVHIQSFLTTIELKGFDLEQIEINDFGILSGKYKNDPSEKSVSDQSHKQKHALRNALFYHHVEAYVYNLIWLNRIEKTNFYAEYGQHDDWNILAGEEISINELLKAIAFNGESAIWEDDHYLVNSFSKVSHDYSTFEKLKQTCDILGKSKSAKSNLTRHKLEAISQNSIEEDLVVPDKITVLKGRAGTGKTIRLLQFARQCCEANKKCIFLTYNQALIGDIRRLLAFTDFYDDSLMRIETMHYFFSEIMKLYGIDNAYINDENFEEIYNIRLGELKTKIEETKQPLDWDFVLVDEAQDWTTNEIDVLISLFSLEQIVIADGVDQFVRSTKKNAWNDDAGNDLFHINYTKSLRQKSNLVAFVNAFAQKAGIDWQVEENEKLMGGRVIIAPAISAKLLQEVKDDCLGKENALYDILVLLTSDASQPNFMAQMLPLWKDKGVPLFDGTNKKNRELLSLNVDEARVFHYNSCRGIEGWSVFCTDLDVLVRERFISKKYPSRRIGETDYDRRMRIMKDIYMWILMPLTRAIDTLVITIREEKSEIGQLLYELSKMYDFVEWRIH